MDSLFLFAALAVLIVFMFRNNQKRKKQAEQLQSSIAVGASVMLTSGIYGEIKSIDGDRLVIETTPGTKLSVIKLAVREIVAAPQPKAKKTALSADEAVAPVVAKKPAAKKTAK